MFTIEKYNKVAEFGVGDVSSNERYFGSWTKLVNPSKLGSKISVYFIFKGFAFGIKELEIKEVEKDQSRIHTDIKCELLYRIPCPH